jgi:SAM-dependent methyltransferase
LDHERSHGWTTDDWVRKLRQQARDSREYRHRLYERVGLKDAARVLDVGCGTGAVTLDIAEHTSGQVVGVDIDAEKLEEAERALGHLPNVSFQEADARDLPFPDGSFDLVTFNIVLVYVPDKLRAVEEMARVTTSGGVVLATCEPDYAGEVVYPEDPFRPIMHADLEAMGADLETGRKLKTLFTRAGLETEVNMDTTSGFTYQQDDARRLEMFQEQFWVLEKGFMRAGWSHEEIAGYREVQEELMRRGLSFSFMPIFYAIGRKI